MPWHFSKMSAVWDHHWTLTKCAILRLRLGWVQCNNTVCHPSKSFMLRCFRFISAHSLPLLHASCFHCLQQQGGYNVSPNYWRMHGCQRRLLKLFFYYFFPARRSRKCTFSVLVIRLAYSPCCIYMLANEMMHDSTKTELPQRRKIVAF